MPSVSYLSILSLLVIGFNLILSYLKYEKRIFMLIVSIFSHIICSYTIYSALTISDVFTIFPFFISLIFLRDKIDFLITQNVLVGVATFTLVTFATVSSSFIVFILFFMLFFAHYWANGSRGNITSYLFSNLIIMTLLLLNSIVFGDLTTASSQMLNENFFNLLSTSLLIVPMLFMVNIYISEKRINLSAISLFGVLLYIVDKHFHHISEVTNNLNNEIKDKIFVFLSLLILLYLFSLLIGKRTLGVKNHQFLVGIITVLLISLCEDRIPFLVGMISWMMIISLGNQKRWINLVGNLIPVVILKYSLLNFSMLVELGHVQKISLFVAVFSLILAFLINEKTTVLNEKGQLLPR